MNNYCKKSYGTVIYKINIVVVLLLLSYFHQINVTVFLKCM